MFLILQARLMKRIRIIFRSLATIQTHHSDLNKHFPASCTPEAGSRCWFSLGAHNFIPCCVLYFYWNKYVLQSWDNLYEVGGCSLNVVWSLSVLCLILIIFSVCLGPLLCLPWIPSWLCCEKNRYKDEIPVAKEIYQIN